MAVRGWFQTMYLIMSWHCNDLLLHTGFHLRSSSDFAVIKSLLSYRSLHKPSRVYPWPLSCPPARQKSHIAVRAARTLGLPGDILPWCRRSTDMQGWPGASLQELCGSLRSRKAAVRWVCLPYLLISGHRWGWYGMLKGPSAEIHWDFLQLSKHLQLGTMQRWLYIFIGFWKNKPTRTVIPGCVAVMFTVMLLRIYAA